MKRRNFLKTAITLPFIGVFPWKSLANTPSASAPSMSAYEKVGTRRLIVLIRRSMENVARQFVFEPFDDALAQKMKYAVSNMLNEQYVNNGVLESFQVFASSYGPGEKQSFVQARIQPKGCAQKFHIYVTVNYVPEHICK
jgi:hypothetical protein